MVFARNDAGRTLIFDCLGTFTSFTRGSIKSFAITPEGASDQKAVVL